MRDEEEERVKPMPPHDPDDYEEQQDRFENGQTSFVFPDDIDFPELDEDDETW